MKVFDMPRGSGKTTVMINWLAEKPGNRVLIVGGSALGHVRDRYMADHGASTAEARSRILTGRAAMTALRGTRSTEIGIDELETVLGELFMAPVGMATLTT